MLKPLRKFWEWLIAPTIEIDVKCNFCHEMHRIKFKCSKLPQELYDKWRGNPVFSDIEGDLTIKE